jgi:hypothetical protein
MLDEHKKPISISDFPTFSALNCPAENFPAIEEVDIRPSALDKRRLDFIFENTAILQHKLTAFRNGKLRVEPNQYFHVCKRIRQEIKYLKDGGI